MEFFVKAMEQAANFNNCDSFTLNMEIVVEKPERQVTRLFDLFSTFLNDKIYIY
jgi:hypothetical protein